MSKDDENILRKIAEAIPQLTKDKQHYLLGVAEGMAIAREEEQAKQKTA